MDKIDQTLITPENAISSRDSRTLASSQPFQDSVHVRSLNLDHNPVQSTLQEYKDLHCCNFFISITSTFPPLLVVTNSQFTVLFYLERCA